MSISKLYLGMVLGGACAGGTHSYGPGMGGTSRQTAIGVVPNAPGSSFGTVVGGEDYQTSETGMGVQLGLRFGVATVSAGGLESSATKPAWDLHADFVYAGRWWGLGATVGYGGDVALADDKFSYFGFPVGAYGQLGWERVFFHAGGARIFGGSVKRNAPDESASADSFRGFGGVTWVFARRPSRDIAFRLEARVTKSSSFMLAGQEAQWNSTGLLAELIWHSF